MLLFLIYSHIMLTAVGTIENGSSSSSSSSGVMFMKSRTLITAEEGNDVVLECVVRNLASHHTVSCIYLIYCHNSTKLTPLLAHRFTLLSNFSLNTRDWLPFPPVTKTPYSIATTTTTTTRALTKNTRKKCTSGLKLWLHYQNKDQGTMSPRHLSRCLIRKN